MVVGSYASAFHGEPRMTQDIDVVIEPNGETIKLLVDLVDRDRFYLGNAEEAFRSPLAGQSLQEPRPKT